MKGLAYALGRPLIGVGTLDALARPLLGRSMPVLVALDARKSEVYGACFDQDGVTLVQARAEDPILLAREVAEACPEGPILAAGEGILAWKAEFESILGTRLHLASPDEHVVRASVIARMALESEREPVDPALIEPVYLRRSEAEVKRDAEVHSDMPEPVVPY
jgi:tRNA threonylcarbamoyladenosine biosynthesis protein TsaB